MEGIATYLIKEAELVSYATIIIVCRVGEGNRRTKAYTVIEKKL